MKSFEKRILQIDLEKILPTLDSDEGMRIDNGNNKIFVNKIAKKICINISSSEKEEFVYKYDTTSAFDFLKGKMNNSARIFVY